jgi:predicted  nucleic acid-binding Zn ribbon protein
MTLEELNLFCEEMYKRLEFKSENERLTDILKWAEAWQAKNLLSN